jgi:hypothetical protein
MPSDTREFTTGREQIVMELPQIAFIPPAGWAPFTGVKTEQKPTDVRIANPSLIGNAGMISCILFPADGQSLTDRVEQFLSRMPDRIVERTQTSSASGIPITFVHTLGHVPGKPIEKHTMFCFFTNRAGQVVNLYCIGNSEDAARTTTNAFLQSLRFDP